MKIAHEEQPIKNQLQPVWTGILVAFYAPIFQLQITPNVKEISWELTEL
jgi:hypothetical protein